MTYNPNYDRAYWRLEDDKRLIEAAKESGHELALVLGERLETCAGESDESYAYMEKELAKAEAEAAELETQIEDLKQQLAIVLADAEELHESRGVWMRQALDAMDALSAMPELGREVIKQNKEQSQ